MQDESFLKSRVQKIYQFLKPPLLTLGRFLTFIVRELFSHVLKNFFTPSALWSISILFMFFLFFIFDDFRNKYSNWFFDSVSKVTGKSSTTGDVHINGSVEATVSRPFKDATQACWYYHANYTHSHSYTVLWNRDKNFNVNPKMTVKIRVIAEPAHWQAENCIEENGQVKLVGIEFTEHSIEAQFTEETGSEQGKEQGKKAVSEKNNDFVEIAKSRAYYKSALFFDKNGRITERKVLSNKGKGDFQYISSPHLCEVIKKATTRGEVECPNSKVKDLDLKEQYTFQKLLGRSDNFNILQIGYDSNPDINSIGLEKYHQAIIFYIIERENLHKELSQQGCGAISIEPEFRDDFGKFIQTSIAFLCFKKSGPSHVRLMHRVSESSF